MARFLCKTQYLGTRYCGWQIQKNGISLQGVIQEKLAVILGRPVPVHGSSRTDAGVHAEGQLFFFDMPPNLKDPRLLFKSLNALLPPDVKIIDWTEVRKDFNPRGSNGGKLYRYEVWNSPVPNVFGRERSWWVRGRLDAERMRDAARELTGKRDFSAFCGKNAYLMNPVKTIQSVNIREREAGHGKEITFEVSGDAFLKQMVRIMVGTLVDVGKGRLGKEVFRDAFKVRKRGNLGTTAPACGLTLARIRLNPDPFAKGVESK